MSENSDSCSTPSSHSSDRRSSKDPANDTGSDFLYRSSQEFLEEGHLIDREFCLKEDRVTKKYKHLFIKGIALIQYSKEQNYVMSNKDLLRSQYRKALAVFQQCAQEARSTKDRARVHLQLSIVHMMMCVSAKFTDPDSKVLQISKAIECLQKALDFP